MVLLPPLKPPEKILVRRRLIFPPVMSTQRAAIVRCKAAEKEKLRQQGIQAPAWVKYSPSRKRVCCVAATRLVSIAMKFAIFEAGFQILTVH